MDALANGLNRLGALETARRIRDGETTSVKVVEACLERIAEREPVVGAWAHIDPDYARAQAARADEMRGLGIGTGPLHGVPVGVKDIIDTSDFPTEYGAPALKGRQSGSDEAAVVTALRDAGAVIMGKTVTTEMAVFHPGKTANPVDPSRTPGGSSSGSAAAVADVMVPLALGTQTAGSVIRPAAYCGVVGYKPTFGLISRHGVLNQSPALDTVGCFARSVEDVALLTDCLTASDTRDRDMWQRSRPRLCATALEEPPVTPQFAFVKTSAWDQAEDVTRAAFSELAEALGDRCDEFELPEMFARGFPWQRQLQCADIARNYGPIIDASPDQFSDNLRAMANEGRRVSAVDYNTAREFQHILNSGLEEVFDRFDAIITPAATGPAPVGLSSTGSPVFCCLWTFLGVPAVTLPLLDVDGLPLGVQLIGARRDDARLLRTARWLVKHLGESDAGH
ncbi:MAG: amidase [Pseudomonadota bacterium]|nr:amidase [Pseudomonadota bacterium]